MGSGGGWVFWWSMESGMSSWARANLAGTMNPLSAIGEQASTFDMGETVTPLIVTAMGDPISRTAVAGDVRWGGGGGGGGAAVGCGGGRPDWCCRGAIVATRTAVICKKLGEQKS